MDPGAPDPSLRLAHGLFQAGELAKAAHVLTRVLWSNPAIFEAHALLGLARAELGSLRQAARALRKAAILRPEVGDIWFNLAEVAAKHDRHLDAFNAYRAAAATQPLNPAPFTEMGIQAERLDMHDTAEWAFAHAVSLNGLAPRPYLHLGLLHATCGRRAQAVSALRRATVLSPTEADTAVNLANVLRKSGDRDTSGKVIARGLVLAPGYTRLWSTRAALRFEAGDVVDGARAATISAILEPAHADAYGNLAQCLFLEGRANEAVLHGSRAALISPELATIRFNLAMYQIGFGDLARGWANYAYRGPAHAWPTPKGLPPARFTRDAAPGKSVLITAEQGLGDEILMASCLPDAIQALRGRGCETIVVECDPRLAEMYRRSFPGIDVLPRLVTRSSSTKVPDYSEAVDRWSIESHLSTGDLPGLVRQSVSDFSTPGGFLSPDESKVEALRGKLRGEDDRPIVGLCWRSRRERVTAGIYYPPLESFEPILTTPGLRFLSLQYDEPEQDIAWLRDRFGVAVEVLSDIDMMDDIESVAALISVADHVVTANTSVLHLSGAIGAPTSLLDYGFGWYTLGAGRYPWYPSVHYHARMPDQGWEVPAQQAADDLSGLAR